MSEASPEPLARSRALLYALVAVLVWGASFAATKRAVAELSPWSVLFVRSTLGTAIVAAFAASRGHRRLPPRDDWPTIVFLAAVGLLATQSLQAYALRWSTSANTAWLITLNPVVTAAGAALLIGERLSGRWLGIATAFLGALLIVGGGKPPGELLALPSTRGDALTLVSTVTWTAYTIVGRSYASRRPPLESMPALLLASSILTAGPFLAIGGWRELAALSASGWASVLYLSFACTAFAFVLYAMALESLQASEAAAFIYVEPLVAQAIGVFLLDEPLRATTLAGGAAILAGVWLVARAPGRAVPPVAEMLPVPTVDRELDRDVS